MVGGGINVGCRHLIETHAGEVARTEFESDAYTIDCDTPEDYQLLVARFAAAPAA